MSVFKKKKKKTEQKTTSTETHKISASDVLILEVIFSPLFLYLSELFCS